MKTAHTKSASANTTIGLVALLCLFPAVARAEIVINEIAWMGTSVSANDEWIELYNDGEAVDLSLWTITDSNGLSISLSGTLQAGAYYLLERTDDETVPGKTADLIYTGALSNTGTTLVLKNGSATVDQVASGENWSVAGGDNVTKETAQKTASGWTTGSPTPKAPNSAYTPRSTTPSPTTSTGNAQTTVAKKNTAPKVSLTTSESALKVTIEGGKYAYVNQPAVFYAKATGVTGKIYDSLVYSWSFGDATGKRGSKVTHTYTHPGTYVIVLAADYATHEASTRLEVEVLPLALTLSRAGDGRVLINNSAEYELDISGATLRSGDTTFLLPMNTVLLSGASLAVPTDTFTKLSPQAKLTLKDRAGTLLAEFPTLMINASDEVEEDVREEMSVKDESEEELPKVTLKKEEKEEMALSLPTPLADEKTEEIPSTTPVGATQVAAVSESKENSKALPYLGFIGIVLVGLLALYARKLV